mmetsp:Transcript_22001/g.42202  ORF Transcript_22001/g.42202 Transcript_22001/m.42202 type:complete len:312 (-) Transcript_22001:52-987(-)
MRRPPRRSCRLTVALLIGVPSAVFGLANQGSPVPLARREGSADAVHKKLDLEAAGGVLTRAESETALPAPAQELPVPLGDDLDGDRPLTSLVVPFAQYNFSDEEVQRMKQAYLLAQREGRFAGINVTIYGAHGLKVSGTGWMDTSPDPYVNVSLVNKSETQYSTEVKYDTSSPTWDESYTVADFEDGDTFEFVLMDRNKYAEDSLIGRGYVASNWFFPVGFEGLVYLDDAGVRSAHLHIGLSELSGEALKSEPHGGIGKNLTSTEIEGTKGEAEREAEADKGASQENAASYLGSRGLAFAALLLVLGSSDG